jgi:hypothetical protein
MLHCPACFMAAPCLRPCLCIVLPAIVHARVLFLRSSLILSVSCCLFIGTGPTDSLVGNSFQVQLSFPNPRSFRLTKFCACVLLRVCCVCSRRRAPRTSDRASLNIRPSKSQNGAPDSAVFRSLCAVRLLCGARSLLPLSRRSDFAQLWLVLMSLNHA